MGGFVVFSNNKVYTISGEVYDITDPSNPKFIKTINLPAEGTEDLIDIYGDYLFFVGDGQNNRNIYIYKYDQQSDSYSLVGTESLGTYYTSDIWADNGKLFVANVNGLKIYSYGEINGDFTINLEFDDAQDGTVDYHEGFLYYDSASNRLYVHTFNAIKILDVSNPSNPQEIGVVQDIDGDGNNESLGPFTVDANVLYVVDNTGKLYSVDVNDPTNPKYNFLVDLGQINTVWGSKIEKLNNKLFILVDDVNTHDRYLKVVDLQDVQNPQVYTINLPDSYNIDIVPFSISEKDYLMYFANGDFNIYEVTDPSQTKVVFSEVANPISGNVFDFIDNNNDIQYVENILSYASTKTTVVSTHTNTGSYYAKMVGDTYSVKVETNKAYKISLNASNSVRLYMLDNQGKYIDPYALNVIYIDIGKLIISPREKSFKVIVEGKEGTPYKLQMQEISLNEANSKYNSDDAPNILLPNITLQNILTPNGVQGEFTINPQNSIYFDRDIYVIQNAQANTYYKVSITVNIQNVNSPSPDIPQFLPYISVWDSKNQELKLYTTFTKNTDNNGNITSVTIEGYFFASSSGDYYVSLDSPPIPLDSPVSYTIQATKVNVTDTVGNSPETAEPVMFDNNNTYTRNESIAIPGDVDVYKITVSQQEIQNGTVYKIELTTQNNLPPVIDVLKETTSPNNGTYPEFIPIEYNPDEDAYILRPDTEGNYYIQITDWETKDYTLTIEKVSDDYPDFYDPNFTYKSIEITNGEGQLQGEIETSFDVDVIKLPVQEGRIYQIELITPVQNEEPEIKTAFVDVSTADASGAPIYVERPFIDDTNLEDGLTLDVLQFTAGETGEYYIYIFGQEDTGSYTVKVKEIDPNKDDHPDSINESFGDDDILGVNGTQDGIINVAGEEDLFKISVEQGKIYEITLTSTNGWPYAYIIDSNGYDVWKDVIWGYINPNSNEKSKLYFIPTQSGDYYVSVTDWNTGTTYSISLKEVTLENDDHPNTVTDTFDEKSTFIFTGGEATITGSKNAEYDVDILKLPAQAGKVYEITVDTTTSNFWPWITILDSNGDYLWYNIDYLWDNNQEKLIFTAPSDGDFYIRVEGSGWDPANNKPIIQGDYTVTVKEIDLQADDHANTVSKVTQNDYITLDESGQGQIKGKIETYIDKDFLALPVEKGYYYRVQLITTDNNWWGYLDFFGEDGKPLWEKGLWDEINWEWNSDKGIIQSVVLTPSEDKTYYILVDGDLGDYAVKVERITPPQDDFPNSINVTFDESSTVILSNVGNLGKSIKGSLETSFDKDVFKLVVSDSDVGKPFTITLSTTDTNFYPYLDVVDEDGNYLWREIEWKWDELDENEVVKIEFTPQKAGDYYIKVGGWQQGNYTLTVKPDAYNDTPADSSTKKKVAVGNPITDYLETYDDIDWIKVSLQKGEVYEINVESEDFDVVAYVVDENGLPLAFDDNSGSGTNAKIYFKPSQVGNYYIEVFGDGIGKYKVSVNKVNTSNDKESEDVDTEAQVNLVNGVGSYKGSIDYPYDVDWVRVNLEANKKYSISLSGSDNLDPVIVGIYDSQGNHLGYYNDNANPFTTDAYIEFTPNKSGVYYIALSGFTAEDIGNYDLTIKELTVSSNGSGIDSPNNDINNTRDKAIDININEYVDGVIDYEGDVDVFKVHLIGGKTYYVEMFGLETNNGSLPDPLIIHIEDENGNVVSEGNDNNGISLNSFVEFTPNKTGDYYIFVSGANNSTGTYQVKVSEAPSDVEIGTQSKAKWTIMVYMAADNDLESAAIDDLNEMEYVNLPNDIKVTFLIDRAEGYDTSNGDWTGTKVGIVTFDQDPQMIKSPMEDWGEKNTGDPSTLKEFINWSIQKAPAENYMLVIWDHGSGFTTAQDEESGDYLTLDEIVQAIKQSDLPNGKVDVLGFDACLMATLDTVYTLKDVADYIVASPELEPEDGWDYTKWFQNITQDKDNTVTQEELIQDVVTAYGEAYQNYPQKIALTGLKTDGIGGLISSLKELNDSLANAGQDATKIKSVLSEVSIYGELGIFVDLKDLVSKISAVSDQIKTDANNVINQIQNIIVAAVDNDGNDNTSPSVSIYMPGYIDTTYLAFSDIADEANIADMYNFFYG